jgi:hypothetical protein
MEIRNILIVLFISIFSQTSHGAESVLRCASFAAPDFTLAQLRKTYIGGEKKINDIPYASFNAVYKDGFRPEISAIAYIKQTDYKEELLKLYPNEQLEDNMKFKFCPVLRKSPEAESFGANLLKEFSLITLSHIQAAMEPLEGIGTVFDSRKDIGFASPKIFLVKKA